MLHSELVWNYLIIKLQHAMKICLHLVHLMGLLGSERALCGRVRTAWLKTAEFLLTFRSNPFLSSLREICDVLSKCIHIHELKLACRVLSFPAITLWFCFTVCRKERHPVSPECHVSPQMSQMAETAICPQYSHFLHLLFCK